MEGEMLLVASKVKAYAKSKGVRTSGDFLTKMNEVVHQSIDRSVARAQGEKVGTLKERHA
ncbi:hypothetical protein ACFL1U_03125 [Patescibacteria group bacterium]